MPYNQDPATDTNDRSNSMLKYFFERLDTLRRMQSIYPITTLLTNPTTLALHFTGFETVYEAPVADLLVEAIQENVPNYDNPMSRCFEFSTKDSKMAHRIIHPKISYFGTSYEFERKLLTNILHYTYYYTKILYKRMEDQITSELKDYKLFFEHDHLSSTFSIKISYPGDPEPSSDVKNYTYKVKLTIFQATNRSAEITLLSRITYIDRKQLQHRTYAFPVTATELTRDLINIIKIVDL